jgi:hypothetical protein
VRVLRAARPWLTIGRATAVALVVAFAPATSSSRATSRRPAGSVAVSFSALDRFGIDMADNFLFYTPHRLPPAEGFDASNIAQHTLTMTCRHIMGGLQPAVRCAFRWHSPQGKWVGSAELRGADNNAAPYVELRYTFKLIETCFARRCPGSGNGVRRYSFHGVGTNAPV